MLSNIVIIAFKNGWNFERSNADARHDAHAHDYWQNAAMIWQSCGALKDFSYRNDALSKDPRDDAHDKVVI